MTRCDVTEWDDNAAMVRHALDAFERIDVVFANAGFGAKRGWLEESPEHWRSMVLTNVLGAAYTTRAALPAVKESRGHIVLTSSVAGRRALPGSLYSCTKHAVTAMAEALRQDLNDTGVRVTSIEPGMVDTPFFDERRRRGRAAGRGHRARRDVRGLAAAARRRQRDPDPPDGAAALAQPALVERIVALVARPSGAGASRRRGAWPGRGR